MKKTPNFLERVHPIIGHRTAKRMAALALFVLATVGVGCTMNDAEFRELPADGAELPILRQVSRVHSHETRAMQVVVRNSAGLAKVPLEEIPVDFNKEMLLVITLGRVPSDQYRVQIDRVFREGGALQVEATIEEPGPGAPLAPASPYCIAVVPQCELNVINFLAEAPSRERTWSQSEPGFGLK